MNTNLNKNASFENFIKELYDFTLLHKDGTENQYVSTQDALAAYYIISNIMIKSEADVLLFLTANNLLNVYVKEEHAIPGFDYYFKHSLAIILYYAKINNFPHLKINFIDKELFNNNMIILSIDKLQFSFHGIQTFIKARIPLKYKNHELFSGIRHKSCVSDLYHKVLEHKHLFSNQTYKGEPLIEKAYEFANLYSNQPISKSKLKKMLPNYCFDYSNQSDFNTDELDKYDLEKFVGRRYIVSFHLRQKSEFFDKVLNYLKENGAILVNLQSTADYLIVENEDDLRNEAKRIDQEFTGKVISLNLDNLNTSEIDVALVNDIRSNTTQVLGKKKTKKCLREAWDKLCLDNIEKASLEENKNKLTTISAALKVSDDEYREAIELIKKNGYIPIKSVRQSKYFIVRDDLDLKRISELLNEPYLGSIIKLK